MKRNRFVPLLLFFIFCSSAGLNAQYLENEPTKVQRIFWGGELGLSFGSYTHIAVNPVVGYRLTNRLSAGVGVNYTYAKSTYYNYSGNMYGGNIFASFTIIKDMGEVLPMWGGGGILLYAEYNIMNIEDYYDFPGITEKWIPSPMAGPAYQTPIGPKSYMLIMLLFNFNESTLNPYPNPVIKVSVQF